MRSFYESIQLLGLQSLDAFWFPILVWTFVALLVFIGLKLFRKLNPIYLYHLRVATIAAIPIGFFTSFLIQKLGTSFKTSSFDPAVFVVETPQTFYLQADYSLVEFAPNWFEPNFLIGLATSLIVLGSLVMLIRLILNYFDLKKLYSSLIKIELRELPEFDHAEYSEIKLAFHEHPMVPFTFGCKTPVIVLPEHIIEDHGKVRMAIQHELVHIQRGDYLIQLVLSVIESIFWFHPLIHLGSREIETYREISCDQQVLSTSGISLKEYASMLYELLPLNRELGSFSVTMAVKQSTLKQRIETMKYHKLHNTSLKRSLLFLILMITAVTLPIACSDMRGPEGISMEELESSKLEFTEFIIEANGKEIINLSEERGVGVGLAASNIAAFNIGNYGIIALSLRPFEGGTLSGSLDGNIINTEVNGISFKITSNSQISQTIDKADVWAKLYIEKQTSLGFGQFASISSLEKKLDEKISTPKTSEDGDYFVVVEQMPQLVGGLRGLQSKVQYPEMAKRAGIEGRVTVQFIVNEEGKVENPRVIRGIGGGCDEAALEAVKLAEFTPGIQRGEHVRVQYSLPIVFRLIDTD